MCRIYIYIYVIPFQSFLIISVILFQFWSVIPSHFRFPAFPPSPAPIRSLMGSRRRKPPRP